MARTDGLNISRRNVLRGSTGLVIGFLLPQGGRKAEAAASAAVDPNAFVRVGADSRVTVVVKHLEVGQGAHTGLATLVAEELDADWSQIRTEAAPVNPAIYGNSKTGGLQVTGGSTSMAASYDLMRRAGAAARAMLVSAAAQRWKVRPQEIRVENGVISHPASGRSGRFGEFAEAAAALPIPPEVQLKDPSTFKLIGREDRTRRPDSAGKVNGSAIYTIDIREPGMLTAVVARSPRFGGRPAGADAEAALKIKGVVAVKPISNGYVVYANGMWPAIQGREALVTRWNDSGAERRGSEEMYAEYLAAAKTPGSIAAQQGDLEAALTAAGSEVIEAAFQFPYLAHAPLEPLDGYINWTGSSADVRYGSQLQSLDVAAIAGILGLPKEKVTLTPMLAGGSFGRRGVLNLHFAKELAEVAKAIGPGKAVKLVWTREDDIRGGAYRPLIVHRLRGAVRNGEITAWHSTVVGQSFLAGTAFEGMIKNGVDPVLCEGVSENPYAVPNFRCEVHVTSSPITTAAWRSVGHSHTGYAVECFLDRLLARTGKDPVAGRLELLKGRPRAAGVLKAVAELADWKGPGPFAGRARGVAVVESYDTFVAQIAEVSLRADGTPKVHKVWCAVDCGVAVNPDVIRAQMEGGISYGLGHALYAQAPIEAGAPKVSNFTDYRALILEQMPEVEVAIIPSAEPPTGVGEPGVPPAAPAVANALARLTGAAPDRLPMVKTA